MDNNSAHKNVSDLELNFAETLPNDDLRLKRHVQFLETFVAGINASAIVAMTDLDGNITFVNDRFVEISGYSREELMGRNHRILNSGFHSKEFFAGMWAEISQGKIWHGEVCNKKKDGSLYWVDATISRILGENGEPQYLAVRFEITDRKLKEEQLIYNTRLASVGEMAAGLAHQINNPLSVISGFLDTLTSHVSKIQNPDPAIPRAIERMNSNISRISKIIEGLRVFASDPSKNYEEMVTLQTIVDDTLRLCSERFMKHQIEVKTKEVPKAAFKVNRPDFSRALLAVLINSFEAIQGLDQKWISLECELVENHRVRISVTDSGSGIPNDVADRLMQPFFTTKGASKAGLGLSFAMGVVKKYGGSLTLDRQSPHTRFVIEVPYIPK